MKGTLYCICNEVENREDCLTKCPKGIALKPDICAFWPTWKKDLSGFKKVLTPTKE